MAINTKINQTLRYLVAEGIGVSHGFTTRLGGVSKGYLASLNLGTGRGDEIENVEENYRILARELGFSMDKLVITRQIHTDIVRAVTAEDAGKGIFPADYPACDALVTNTPGVALAVFTADCTPILLHDPVTGAVGAVHAGWRGTAAAIAGKAVEAMAEHYGCRPENIRAAIGPNIGVCCFQTDADVPEAMLAAFGDGARDYIRPAGEKYFVDLKGLNAMILGRAGVLHTEISEDCTACQCHRYWSHRVTRGQRGSQGAIIVCGEERL